MSDTVGHIHTHTHAFSRGVSQPRCKHTHALSHKLLKTHARTRTHAHTRTHSARHASAARETSEMAERTENSTGTHIRKLARMSESVVGDNNQSTLLRSCDLAILRSVSDLRGQASEGIRDSAQQPLCPRPLPPPLGHLPLTRHSSDQLQHRVGDLPSSLLLPGDQLLGRGGRVRGGGRGGGGGREADARSEEPEEEIEIAEALEALQWESRIVRLKIVGVADRLRLRIVGAGFEMCGGEAVRVRTKASEPRWTCEMGIGSVSEA
eukprot:2727182-Rhodomonas_salina.1